MRIRIRFLIAVFSMLPLVSQAQWQAAPKPPYGAQFFTQIGETIVEGSSDDDNVYRTTDFGSSWSQATNGMHKSTLTTSLLTVGNTLLSSAWGGIGSGVFRSTDSGNSWTLHLTHYYITFALVYHDGKLYATGYNTPSDQALLRSNDTGKSWNVVTRDLPYSQVLFSATLGSDMFLGTGDSGVFISKDDGLTWTAASNGLNGWWISNLKVNGDNIYACCGNRNGSYHTDLFQSSDHGLHWTSLTGTFHGNTIRSCAFAGSDLYIGSDSGVFVSHDQGLTWFADTLGMGKRSVNGLASYGSYLFAGSDGIYRRSVGSSDVFSADHPIVISYSECTPNPFNDRTTLRFSLDRPRWVHIVCLNSLGEMVFESDQTVSAGPNTITLDMKNKPAGVYFCCISTPEFSKIMKIVKLEP
jgi:photosystem II stability/assembly factor-like uncharacterized protein